VATVAGIADALEAIGAEKEIGVNACVVMHFRTHECQPEFSAIYRELQRLKLAAVQV
jgi:hypothetical protein